MVRIKNILGLSAVAGGGMKIQRLDGNEPPAPVGAALTLNAEEWRRVSNLLELDRKSATATFEANRDGGDDGSKIVWVP